MSCSCEREKRHCFKSSHCDNNHPRITVINDAFFDDISAFIYLIGLSIPCNLVTNALGYAVSDTALRVNNGVTKWAKKNDLEFKKTNVSQDFYNNTDPRNNPFRSLIDLNFASNLADHLCFFDLDCEKECHNLRVKYTKIILVLGPYSDLARELTCEMTCESEECRTKHSIWCSGSSLINTDAYTFPDTLYLGKGSNAGIDPTATLTVWQIANKSLHTAILVSRQPPIQDVYNAVKCIETSAGRKLAKVLKYSIEKNPLGTFVWDLGLSVTQQHPDIITQQQLYDADYSDDPTKAIKLTIATQFNSNNIQVSLVNVNIGAMIDYLVCDLKRNRFCW
jgi:hypothetical protein